MKHIVISFPQIVVTKREICVSGEIANDLINHRVNVAAFVWANMTEDEQNNSQGEEWVKSAIELGYAGVKLAK